MTTHRNRVASVFQAAARRSAVIVLALTIIASACVGDARADNTMTVGDVAVDVTAKNAAAARDQAIAGVQRKAFDILVKRLVPNAADQARLTPSQAEIENLVQDFAVENERTSDVRYIGLYTVRFRAGRVHKYLTDAGVNSIGDLQQVLVVPVYRGQTGNLLWEQNNAWRTAWHQGGLGGGPVTLILPNADSFDTGTLSAGAAASGDMTALGSLIRRYHVAGLIVAIAEPKDPIRGPASGLAVTLAIYDTMGSKSSRTLSVDPVSAEQSEKALQRAVAASVDSLESNWRQSVAATGSTGLSARSADMAPVEDDSQGASAEGGRGTIYSIAMPLSGIGEWVKLRNALGSMPGVQLLTLDALTRDNIAISLDFAGDTLALQAALSASGYVLVQTAPGNAAGPGAFLLRRSVQPLHPAPQVSTAPQVPTAQQVPTDR